MPISLQVYSHYLKHWLEWNNWIEKDQWFKKSLKKEEVLKVYNVREEVLKNIKIIVKEVKSWLDEISFELVNLFSK